MTLAEIKAMFKIGQVWTGKRTPGFKGEACTITKRTVSELRGNAIIFSLNGDGQRYWCNWPKARDIIEARPGYLRFKLPTVDAEVELTY